MTKGELVAALAAYSDDTPVVLWVGDDRPGVSFVSYDSMNDDIVMHVFEFSDRCESQYELSNFLVIDRGYKGNSLGDLRHGRGSMYSIHYMLQAEDVPATCAELCERLVERGFVRVTDDDDTHWRHSVDGEHEVLIMENDDDDGVLVISSLEDDDEDA